MSAHDFASAGLFGGIFLVLALPGVRQREARAWVIAVLLVVLLDYLVTLLPLTSGWNGSLQFNWVGKALDVFALVAITVWLVVTQRLAAQDIGLTLRQSPGTDRVLLYGVLPYLVVLAVLAATWLGNATPAQRETLAFEATMPGLTEELCYRGLLLGIFNRMFIGRVSLLGAPIGYGAIAVSLVFGLLHGLALDASYHLSFDPVTTAFTGLIGFWLAWLRMRTGSLVVPVLVHNATNVILEAVPKLL